MSLIKKCPRCGAVMRGGARFCGECGCDTAEAAVAARARSQREAAVPTWSDEPPRPVETARFFDRDEELPSRAPARRDRWKLAAAIAGAAVVALLALWLILRMNRPAAPALSEPRETEAVHVIAAEESSPVPTETPRPTDTPVPATLPPASTAPPAAVQPVVNEAGGVAYVVPAYADVYAEPGLDEEVIGTAEQGDGLTRTGVLDGWTRVLFEGREGYVRNTDLTLTEPTPTPEPTPLPMDFEVDPRDDTVVVISDTANLRAGPSTDFPVKENVPYGTELRRTGSYDGWSQVSWGGETVYVSESLLELPAAATPEPTEAPPEATEAPSAPAETDAPVDASAAGQTLTMRLNGHVRTGPGTEYDSLGIAEGGSTLTASGRQGDWYIVTFNGQTGYVFADLVE